MTDLMRHHPEVLRELRKELDTVVGRGRMVEVSDLVHMKYLDAVIKECTRLHPAIPHESMQATTIAGYHIPAGSRVFLKLWAMGWGETLEERTAPGDVDDEEVYVTMDCWKERCPTGACGGSSSATPCI
ncbi:hypothetical protein R1sor_006547 [Riccia sorocarpa]|uniref:Cytochrome P450 n=1 Tax=Riccia sorocarpa TaxID=122646 RepID=A0ABD3HPM5_9MARC